MNNVRVTATWEENGQTQEETLDYEWDVQPFLDSHPDAEYLEFFVDSSLDNDNDSVKQEDVEDFLKLADKFNDLRETQQVAVDYLMRECNRTFDGAMDDYEDVQVFEGSLGDAARDWTEEYDEIPRHILPYVDWDAYAEELSFYEYDRNYVILNP